MQPEIHAMPSRSKELEVQLQSASKNLRGVSKHVYAWVCAKNLNSELRKMQRCKGLRNVHNWKTSVTVAVKISERLKKITTFEVSTPKKKTKWKQQFGRKCKYK